jgi:hypothetical protein
MSRNTLILIRALWILASCALAAAWRIEALILLIPLAAVGPILGEVTPRTDMDERQVLEDYRASHLALIVSYLLIFSLFGRAWLQQGKEPSLELWLLLVAPLLVRVGVTAARGVGARRLALILGFVFGTAWLAFSTLSHGLAAESALGLSIIVLAAIGLRWPRIAGSLLLLVGLALFALIAASALRQDWVQGLLITIALPVPVIVAGLAFLAASKGARTAPDEFGDLREIS